MQPVLWMIGFATSAFLFSLALSACMIFFALWVTKTVFGEERIAVAVLRYGASRRLLSTIGRAVFSIRSSNMTHRGRVRIITDVLMAGVLVPLIVVLCYWVVLAFMFNVASQGRASPWLLWIGSFFIALVAAMGTCFYVSTGGREGARAFPAMPVEPWVIMNESRIVMAAAMVRLTLLEIAVFLGAAMTFVAAVMRAGDLLNSPIEDPTGYLYVAGAVPMLLLAMAVFKTLPMIFPWVAANRLILQLLALSGASQRGHRGLPVGSYSMNASLRSSLKDLCRLVDRCAVIEARAELAAGVQNPRAVVLRSLAINLRGFLSNIASLSISFDSVRDDLTLATSFLSSPYSRIVVKELAARMRAFNEDGSPKDSYKAAYQNRITSALSKFLTGLEKTHLGFSRFVAIAIILIGVYLFASGVVRIAEVVKLVKL